MTPSGRGTTLFSLLAIVLTGVVIAGAVFASLRDRNRRAEREAMLSRNLEVPGTLARGFPGGAPRLHAALVLMAHQGDGVAILDAGTFRLHAGNDVEFTLTFHSLPEGAESPWNGRSWPRRPAEARSRELPSSFGRHRIELKSKARFHGAEGGIGLFSFHSSSLEHMEVWQGAGSFDRGAGRLDQHLALSPGEPAARILDLTGLAIFLAFEPGAAEETAEGGVLPAAEPGTLAYWRGLFAGALARPIPPARDAIRDAAARLAPRFHDRTLEAGSFLAGRGPWLEAATAAYVLGDAELARSIRDRLRGDVAVIDGIFGAGFRVDGSTPVNWGLIPESCVVLACLGVIPYSERLDFIERWSDDLHWGLDRYDFEIQRYPVIRVLSMTPDPDLLAVAGEHLVRLCGYGNYAYLREYLLNHECPNPHPRAVAAWEAGRQEARRSVRAPLRWALSSPAGLLLYHALIPLAALIVALTPSGGKGSLPRVGGIAIAALLALSFIKVNDFPLRCLLLPLWVFWFVRALRFEDRAPWWLRLAVFFGLTGSGLDLLGALHLAVGHPAPAILREIHPAFCWLAAGWIIIRQRGLAGLPEPPLLRPALVLLAGLGSWWVLSGNFGG